jgi:hypothetical protein
MQTQTGSASTSFEPIPEGAYHVRLLEVDASREGPAGPYWSWTFEIVEPGDYVGRRLWNNTSLSPQAAFKMKETFDAFGVPYDTDTDDMCGSVVKAMVSVRTIQAGARKGELSNQIDRLVAADPDFETPAGADGKVTDDIFLNDGFPSFEDRRRHENRQNF